jgi:hypothetical protein
MYEKKVLQPSAVCIAYAFLLAFYFVRRMEGLYSVFHKTVLLGKNRPL